VEKPAVDPRHSSAAKKERVNVRDVMIVFFVTGSVVVCNDDGACIDVQESCCTSRFIHQILMIQDASYLDEGGCVEIVSQGVSVLRNLRSNLQIKARNATRMSQPYTKLIQLQSDA
jgi:hypothetical protein